MISEEHTTKLIDAKIRFAQERRFMEAQRLSDASDRLPPGQAKVKGLPVLDLGIHPEISTEAWALTVDGLVERPVVIDWNQLGGLEQTKTCVDIHCVTSWSSFGNHWSGVKLSTLLDLAGLRDGASHVLLHSCDGYTPTSPSRMH
jgi:DMSO/TMAO reductase YedYZ molybdopterin-dependent catalytic subunit